MVPALLLFSSCARAQRDPAREVLSGVIAAAEARDAHAVMAFLSPGFRDAEGGGRAEAEEVLRRYLAAYEKLSLTLSDVVIEKGPDAAQATFKVKMSGKPRAVAGLEGLLPRTSRWSFELKLEAEKGGWKITYAAWRQLEEGGPA